MTASIIKIQLHSRKIFDNTWTAYHLRDNRILASYEQKKHFGHSIYFFSILYNDLKAGGGAAATQVPLLIPVRGVQELLNYIHHGL